MIVTVTVTVTVTRWEPAEPVRDGFVYRDAMQGFGFGSQDKVEPELSDANVLRVPCPADGSFSSPVDTVVPALVADISGQPRASALPEQPLPSTLLDPIDAVRLVELGRQLLVEKDCLAVRVALHRGA